MNNLTIEINKSHAYAVADLFVNKAVEGRDVGLIITDIQNLMGSENCAHSVSLGLQKCGLKNALFAGNIAMKLTGTKNIGYIEYENPNEVKEIEDTQTQEK